jgi:hypothetical protein
MALWAVGMAFIAQVLGYLGSGFLSFYVHQSASGVQGNHGHQIPALVFLKFFMGF